MPQAKDAEYYKLRLYTTLRYIQHRKAADHPVNAKCAFCASADMVLHEWNRDHPDEAIK